MMQDTNQNAREKLLKLAQQHLFKHAVPIAEGGLGTNYTDLAQSYFKLGKESSDPSLMLSLNAHTWGGIYPLLTFGGAGQKERWLTKTVNGELIAGHAITEPEAGSEIDFISTFAEKVDHGFVLNGHKKFITNAPIADYLLIYANTKEGLSTFLVEKKDEGATFINKNNLHSFKSSPIGDVMLQHCFIPHDRLIGSLGSGKIIMQSTLEHERAFLFAGIAGIMEKQLETIIRFTKKRKIKKGTLANSQIIAHRLVNMKTRLDTVKLWVDYCAELRNQNKRITLQSSQLKILASEAFLNACSEGVQMMGASSLEVDLALQPFLMDAIATRLLSGSNEIQTNIIASLMGVG